MAWLTPEDLARSEALFDRAAELVRADPVLSTRVRRARLPIDLVWLLYAMELPARARLSGLPVPVMPNVAARVEDFITTAEAFKVEKFSEGGSFAVLAARLRRVASGLARGHEATPPPEAEGRPWFDVQEYVMRLGPADASDVVEDPSASNGLSVRMPGSHRDWAVQWGFPVDLQNRTWHVYAVVRVQPRAETGDAYWVGLHDPAGVENAAVTKRIEDLGEGWQTVDLGVHSQLHNTCRLVVAPCGNPEEVEAVYVDRFFLVREGGESLTP